MILLTDKELLKGQGYISGIYKITNLKNGKIYIGQSMQLRKRFSDYNNYEHNLNTVNSKRQLYQDIRNQGQDTFTFEVIEFCEAEELPDKENYYIKKLNAANPEIGYNRKQHNTLLSNSVVTRFNKSMGHLGLTQTPETKRKKSNRIIALKGHTLIYVDSAKLFGDYIGRSKDQVKNYIRHPMKILDYFLYYEDATKREPIREKLLNKEKLSDTMEEYLDKLDIIDKVEHESVETKNKFFNIAKLSYDNIDETGRPVLEYISKLNDIGVTG